MWFMNFPPSSVISSERKFAAAQTTALSFAVANGMPAAQPVPLRLSPGIQLFPPDKLANFSPDLEHVVDLAVLPPEFC